MGKRRTTTQAGPQNMQQANTALARVDTVKSMLTSDMARARIAEVASRNIDVDELTRVAIMEIASNPALQNCTPHSLLGSVMEAGTVGLKIGRLLGHAYLVPYGSEATLIIGYKGLINLVLRSGQIKSIKAVCVFEKDRFEWYEGTKAELVHVPARGDRGKITHVYSVAKIAGTDEPHFDVMDVEEINAIRDRSKAKSNGPWVTDYNEMARKTVVRRHVKYLPVEPVTAEAAARDEAIELGFARVGDRFESSAGASAFIDATPDGRGSFGFDGAKKGKQPATQKVEGGGGDEAPASQGEEGEATDASSPSESSPPPEQQEAIKRDEILDAALDRWMFERQIDRERAAIGLARWLKFQHKTGGSLDDATTAQIKQALNLMKAGQFKYASYDQE